MEQVDSKELVHMMFGEVSLRHRPDDVIPGKDVIMSVRGLTQKKNVWGCILWPVSGRGFGNRRNAWAGRTELLRAIFGADKFQSGTVEIDGKKIKKFDPIHMVEAGLGLTPEERKTQGVILIHSVRDNLNYASIRINTIGGIIEDKKKREKMPESR